MGRAENAPENVVPALPDTDQTINSGRTNRKTCHYRLIKCISLDGDHSYEGCKKDILCWTPYLEAVS